MREAIPLCWLQRLVMTATLLVLSACGGGSGGGGNDRGDPPPIPPPISPTNLMGVAEFTIEAVTVDESAGAVSVTIGRFGETGNAITTTLLVSGGAAGDATEGEDFLVASKQITFAAGDSEPKTLVFRIVDDALGEGDETLRLALSPSVSRMVNGTTTTSRSNATVTIRDNDPIVGGPPPVPMPTGLSVQFSMSSYEVNETGGTLAIEVSRSGPSTDEFSGLVEVAGGTATAGSDFCFMLVADRCATAHVASVRFPAGDATPRMVQLKINDDLAFEGSESAVLSLSLSSGERFMRGLGNLTTTITIDDDERGAPVSNLAIISTAPKNVQLQFDAVPRADAYKVQQVSLLGPAQIGDDLSVPREVRAPAALHLQTSFTVDACILTQCAPTQGTATLDPNGSAAATGYLKASSGQPGQQVGRAVAIIGDGSLVALGAPDADGGAGAVYLYTKSMSSDAVPAMLPVKLLAPTRSAIGFGMSVALGRSRSNPILVVGAPKDANTVAASSYPRPEDANQSAPDSGAAFIYRLPSNLGEMTGRSVDLSHEYVKPRAPAAGEAFGSAVTMTPDAGELVVGAPGNDSNNAMDSGAVYVVSPTGSIRTMLKAGDVQAGARFGTSLAISRLEPTNSGDAGPRVNAALVVGAPGYRRGAAITGAAYVFRDGGLGSVLSFTDPPRRIVAPAGADGDRFGGTVAVAADASTIAVGASGTDVPFGSGQSTSRGVDAGAVYMYRTAAIIAGSSELPAFFTSQPAAAGTLFGTSVALNADGKVLAVGAIGDGEARAGVSAALTTQRLQAAPNAGAVAVLVRPSTDWTSFTDPRGAQPPSSYVKASNPGAGDGFGAAVALSDDAQTLLVGAPGEDSAATNFDIASKPFDRQQPFTPPAAQADETAVEAGAAYLY